MTTHFRQAALALAVLSLAACSAETPAAAPVPTVTVTVPGTAEATPEATPEATDATPEVTQDASPSATPSTPSNSITEPSDDYDQNDVIGPKQPAIKGTKFQFDPGHDFTKGISPSAEGVLRGRFVTMQDGDTAEYVPVRWSGSEYVGPPEGDVTAYAAKLAPGVVYLSATGCTGNDQTIDGRALGTERCTRARLVQHARAGGPTAMITVKNGQVVKVVEIYH